MTKNEVKQADYTEITDEQDANQQRENGEVICFSAS